MGLVVGEGCIMGAGGLLIIPPLPTPKFLLFPTAPPFMVRGGVPIGVVIVGGGPPAWGIDVVGAIVVQNGPFPVFKASSIAVGYLPLIPPGMLEQS